VCDALADFLNFQGRWDEWLALSEKAEVRAVAAADYCNAGWRAYQAGSIQYQRRQAAAVLACADRTSNFWDTAKAGTREQAIAIRLRGDGHILNDDYSAAIAAFQKALDLHRSLSSESRDVAISLNDLADAKTRTGDHTAAEAHFHEALHVARTVGYTRGVAMAIGNLAIAALNRKDWLGAETFSREALPLSEAIHRQELIAGNNHSLANALVRQGKAAEALPYARRAVEIYTRLDHPDLNKAQATLAECGV
jgi:tetratricopeptide (TPR) repeat protein